MKKVIAFIITVLTAATYLTGYTMTAGLVAMVLGIPVSIPLIVAGGYLVFAPYLAVWLGGSAGELLHNTVGHPVMALLRIVHLHRMAENYHDNFFSDYDPSPLVTLEGLENDGWRHEEGESASEALYHDEHPGVLVLADKCRVVLVEAGGIKVVIRRPRTLDMDEFTVLVETLKALEQ